MFNILAALLSNSAASNFVREIVSPPGVSSVIHWLMNIERPYLMAVDFLIPTFASTHSVSLNTTLREHC